MKRLATLVLLLGFTWPAFSQQIDNLTPQALRNGKKQTSVPEEPAVIHATGRLDAMPEGRKALSSYHQAKRAGLLAGAHKATTVHDLGDTRSFNVIENIQDDAKLKWVAQEFVLKAKSNAGDPAGVYVWVASDQIANGNVPDASVALLREALIERTPAGSYNPSQGIIANNNEVFGEPPDYDDDGILDILIYDITEGTDDCCVLGFVASTDIYPYARPGEGNQADVLYLDANPNTKKNPGVSKLIPEALMKIAAHEYQHLINNNYDEMELTFVDEGLSEWAVMMNGYATVHPVTYLSDPEEHGRDLLGWRTGEDIRTVDRDYERAGFFTSYLVDRLGPALAKGIVQSRIVKSGVEQPARGADAYRAALAAQANAPSLNDLVADFHTANYLNDFARNARFGHANTQYQNVRAVPTVVYDGGATTETALSTVMVQPGGVQYLIWERVEDFTLTLDIDAPVFLSNSVRPQAVLMHKDGTVEIREIPGANGAPVTFAGNYSRVAVLLPHTESDPAPGARPTLYDAKITYSAQWNRSGPQSIPQTIVYDDGAVPGDTTETGVTIEAYELGDGSMMANRFVLPDGATLRNVSVAPYYENQFSGSEVPTTAPRDFSLKIWAGDNAGRPGAELFSLNVTDPRFNAGTTFTFHEIDLSSFENELSALPDTIYIGLTNTGSDLNFLVMGVSRYQDGYEGGNVAFLKLPDFARGWAPFPNLTSNGEAILQDRVLPIRATFLVPVGAVAAETRPELPSEITLSQNYPNPFNPSTTIRFSLPAATQVDLAVYDVLGRRVAQLAQGSLAAGMHEVNVHAGGWGSGVYFYRLSTPERTLTHKMLLLE